MLRCTRQVGGGQRLREDERSGRAEIVKAAPATRVRWMGGHPVVAGLGTAALLVIAGLVFGVFFAWLVGVPADAMRIFIGAVGMVSSAWLALGQVVGPLNGVSGGTPFEPFHCIPNTVSAVAFDLRPAVVLAAFSAVLLGGGLIALRRRDFGLQVFEFGGLQVPQTSSSTGVCRG
ncbi:hypothetical protein GCM10022247_66520 [Allokutzneria multivorans]|uniref:ABC transporter permease n=1 Tax=Allokutzneria multivorans TaxID=1142134 RepID=A0ABP7TW86_9PSEU